MQKVFWIFLGLLALGLAQQDSTTPAATTAAPQVTTEIPAATDVTTDVTTAAPVVTTEVTTAATDVTTAAPVVTTEVTTAATDVTSDVTTAAPTTAAPVVTTEVTTAAPTTAAPTTAAPTTAAPTTSASTTAAPTGSTTPSSTTAAPGGTTVTPETCVYETQTWGVPQLNAFKFCVNGEVKTTTCIANHYYVSNAKVSGCIPAADVDPLCIDTTIKAPVCTGNNLRQMQRSSSLTSYYLCTAEGAQPDLLPCLNGKVFANNNGYLGCFDWPQWRTASGCDTYTLPTTE
ncbi:salivary glue protein Sgs-3 isoform X2 [Drosophila sulfurigaster albostrigata]|uniref:salivary glue protein Sgs-3 isoform X2 n=1 Tax=Drosophila sulfurigaster albostrigata TaxID=89887 RepID=UPI002D21AD78|nr:salivary glue protein Sgs-3 isoform X2 [Drosophila sulfurigaster albostrigata]